MLELLEELRGNASRFAQADGVLSTPIAGVDLIQISQPTQEIHSLHEPAFCLVLQGSKRVMLADQVYEYGRAQFLAVSYAVPIVGQVVQASPDSPYLCLKLAIEPTALFGLLGNLLDAEEGADEIQPGLMLGEATPELLDAAGRLVRLWDATDDIPVLAPMLKREILYRLLRGPHAGGLRNLAFESGMSRHVARAISWLKQNYRARFDMAKLSSEARLSSSALHRHFKVATLMTPLQYQKCLRLQEARRLMVFQEHDAATAGFAVGYESPSQFSREYKRLFGSSPLRDASQFLSTR